MKLSQPVFCLVLLVGVAIGIILPVSHGTESSDSETSSLAPVQEFQISPPKTCKAALVMEATSGEVVFEMNSHQQLPPASMVKMMLVLITLEKVQSGDISLDDLITISASSSRIGGSQVYLKQGEVFSLRELLKSVIIQSANDSCHAIAEYIAGSDDTFVEMMNAKARQLGMTGTIYYSTHGLPPGKGQLPDLSTAYDLAMLARDIVTKFPEVLQWSSLDTEPFRDGSFIMTNTNRLVHQLDGCDGLKTGYYREAGFCVTATAKQNGVRIIAVVMGCEKGKERFSEAARLIKWGVSLYKEMELIVPGIAIDKSVPIIDGRKQETYPLVQRGITAVVRKTRVDEIVMKTTIERELPAPVEPGVVCGSIHFYLDDRELGSSALVTGENIEKLSWWGKLKRVVGL